MPPAVGAVLSYWPFEPAVLLGVELAAVLCLVGGARRGRNHSSATARWRSIAFWLGLATILLALQSPIEMLARQLFWMHMVQHLLLMAVAAPLLALASPWTRMWRGVAFRLRGRKPKTPFSHPRLPPPRSRS